MAFEMLKTDYKDDILNTSVNQLRRYTIVNNADGTISLIDSTAYSTVGTFIGAKDINLICKNMNTIMGYIETSSGDLAQEFQEYFAEQKGIFEDNVEAYMQDFQSNSESQFTVWYDANTAAWSQEVENRINAIIESLTELVEDNGPFVLNKAYRVGNLLTWNIGDGITRGYLVINPVPANMGIYPSNKTYFMEVTREGAQGVGLGMTPRGNWTDLLTYVENDWVVHNWIYWQCKAENTDSEPSESNSNWEKIYDITADMPIQFDEPEENGLSFLETMGNIVSGQTLGNLFKYIKGSFIKLLKKFSDTEYTATGTVITYNSSSTSKAVITKITGTTTASRPNISANVSPNNIQTFYDAENFTLTSNNGSDLSNSISFVGKLRSIPGTSVCDTVEWDSTNKILRKIQRIGYIKYNSSTASSTSTTTEMQKLVFNSSHTLFNGQPPKKFGQIACTHFIKSSSTSIYNRVTIGSDGGMNMAMDRTIIVTKGYADTPTGFINYLVAQYSTSKPIEIVYELETPIETVLDITPILDSYQGTTNVITNASPQVTLDVDFKSRFWTLDFKKIDKANISKNFATTDWGQVAAAPLVKELKEDVGALNDTLPSRSKMLDYKTITSVTNCTCGSFKYVKFGNILFFTASFAATIATPSTYAIRFTLPYAVRDAEASIFSTMASGGGANDVVAYGNINSNSVTVNIHGTHGTGYVFYVQGYVFCDD